MGILRFQRHGRIQEWVAEELGAFKKLGLDYEVVHHRTSSGAMPPNHLSLMQTDSADDASAYRAFVLSSAVTNVASTSHWAVSAAISSGYGERWPSAYSIMPAGIYVSPSIDLRDVSGLSKMEIVVGQHSGSHFSAIHALQDIIPLAAIKLKFVTGRTNRLRCLLENKALAGSMYGVEAYILEQNGYRKLLDTSFMVGFMIVGSPCRNDVEKYFEALQCAQIAIDENPDRYKHYLLQEFPDEIRRLVDLHPCGIGERVVFNDYPDELFTRARDWIAAQGILPNAWLAKAADQIANN